MKKLFYLLFIPLLFFGCSDSNDDPSNISFLEKHEGTVWTSTEDGETLYIRFINNVLSPFEYWFEFEDCYYYQLDTLDELTTITENSNDKLVFQYVEDDGGLEYLDVITLSISGNTLEIFYQYYENGDLYESGTDYLSKSSIDVDNLVLCDD